MFHRLLLTVALAATVLPLWRLANPSPGAAETLSPGSNGQTVLSRYGGHTGMRFTATGFFTTAQDARGRWWLVDPEGYAFYSTGVSYVNSGGYASVNQTNPYRATMRLKYGDPIDEARWATDTLDRLKAWGYNTAGPYSAPSLTARMPYAADLDVLGAVRNSLNPGNNRQLDVYPILYEDSPHDAQYRRYFFDVFHPAFAPRTAAAIASQVAAGAYRGDANLIGYFVDNEVPLWYGRSPNPNSPWYRGADGLSRTNTLADVYIALDGTTAAKRAWVDQLRGSYGTIGALNAAWNTGYRDFADLLDVSALPSTVPAIKAEKRAFLATILGTYYRTVRDALRAVDPQHLYLGSRMIVRNLNNPPEAFQAIATYADVVSINYYIFQVVTLDEMRGEVDSILTDSYRGKPLYLSEFSFAGRDSGMPATVLNGALLETQEQRGQMTSDFRGLMMQSPNVIGDLWWDYYDPPPDGSLHGGENSNLGLVDNEDNPYLRMLYQTSLDSRSVYARRGLAPPGSDVLSAFRLFLPAGDRNFAPRSGGTSSVSTGRALGLPTVAFQAQGTGGSFGFTTASPIASARIAIFDGARSQASAALRRTLVSGAAGAGRHRIEWDGRDDSGARVPSGSYFYVLKVVLADGRTDYVFDTIQI